MRAHDLLAASLMLMGASSLGACDAIIDLDEPNSDQCHRYCDLVAEECSGANLAQFIGHSPETQDAEDGTSLTAYAQQAHCLSYCRLLETTPGAQEPFGNTIACRIGVLDSREQAADRTELCQAAGPGSVVCSDDEGDPKDPAEARARVCANYCEVYEMQCGDTGEPCDCLREDDTPIPVGNGAYTIGATGDTLYCRIYHTTIAMLEDPIMHCGHAAIESAMNVCTNPDE